MAVEGRRAVRPSLLIALGLAFVALLVYWQWPAASTAGSASNPAVQAPVRDGTVTDPAALEVRVEKLKQPPPAPDSMERNPFRFQPKPPPVAAAPPPSFGSYPGAGGRRAAPPPQPAGSQGPPPIPLKFIGRLESPSTGVVALFSDGHGLRPRGHEGDIILGQYRIVHIGVESVVLEYLDGRGRQTIPLTGQGISS
jgi:hypothetical protein